MPWPEETQPRNVEALHRDCVETLKNLIEQARRTCELLESMKDFPVEPEVWRRAVSQRLAENRAQARYQHAREELFKAIQDES